MNQASLPYRKNYYSLNFHKLETKALMLNREVHATVKHYQFGNSSFYSGYRPLMRYLSDSLQSLHVVEVSPDKSCLEPGETGGCTIRFHHPSHHCELAIKGARFELFDGPTLRATGSIDGT